MSAAPDRRSDGRRARSPAQRCSGRGRWRGGLAGHPGQLPALAIARSRGFSATESGTQSTISTAPTACAASACVEHQVRQGGQQGAVLEARGLALGGVRHHAARPAGGLATARIFTAVGKGGDPADRAPGRARCARSGEGGTTLAPTARHGWLAVHVQMLGEGPIEPGAVDRVRPTRQAEGAEEEEKEGGPRRGRLGRRASGRGRGWTVGRFHVGTHRVASPVKARAGSTRGSTATSTTAEAGHTERKQPGSCLCGCRCRA